MFGCESIIGAIAALTVQTGLDYQCREDGHYLAVAKTAETADNYLAAMLEGDALFRTAFGEGGAPSAVIQGNTALSVLQSPLSEAGFLSQLPWIDIDEQNQMIRYQVATQLEAQMPQMQAAQLAALVEQSVSGMLAQPLPLELSRAAIAHEFGHFWYINAFWKNDRVDPNSHYGGAAPDWLDEVAAVSLENDRMTQSRRRSLHDAVRQDDVISLSTFLTIEHPLAEIARQNTARVRAAAAAGDGTNTGTTRIVMLTGDAADDMLSQAEVNPSDFYDVARGFIDYMSERTDGTVFAEISQALVQGQSFADWLADKGPGLGLPSMIEALETDWKSWLQDHA